MSVTTANSRGSGTESSVVLELRNEQTSSGHLFLENSGSNFAKGVTDIFDTIGLLVDNPTCMAVWHDGLGSNSYWQPDVIVVENTKYRKVCSKDSILLWVSLVLIMYHLIRRKNDYHMFPSPSVFGF